MELVVAVVVAAEVMKVEVVAAVEAMVMKLKIKVMTAGAVVEVVA